MLYCDMDGVLADFDSGYERISGERPPNRNIQSKSNWDDEKMWRNISGHKNFFIDLPMMEDAHILWDFIKKYDPTVLTGIPSTIDAAVNQKVDWVQKHLGRDVQVLCCRSADKFKHCDPGDILIDDWDKYRSKWIGAGGIWVAHTSAAKTIDTLRMIGLSNPITYH